MDDFGQTDILADLNEAQREAVTTTEGYVRVIAGAGSGKTRALSHRFAYLVLSLGVMPGNILCVTFTNKAAGEMRTRIRALTHDTDTGYINTFHGFCVSVLQEDSSAINFPKSFLVLDNADIDAMLAIIYEERGLTLRDCTFAKARDMFEIRKTLSETGYFRDLIDMSPEELKRKYDQATEVNDILFYGYLHQQKKCFGLDYNDLIVLVLEIFRRRDDIRLKWQERLQYIMVDEFQDIDGIQHELMEVLAGYHRNLFVVGDPDQTIYTWRGANVRYLTEFNTRFAGTKTIMMNENYRSTPDIVAVANSLIEKNRYRIPKDLVAMRAAGAAEGVVSGVASGAGAGAVAGTVVGTAAGAASGAAAGEGSDAATSARILPFSDGDTREDAEVQLWEGTLPVLCFHGKSSEAEAAWMVRQMQQLHARGVPWRDLCVLYRAHYASRPVEDALVKAQVPYTVFSGVPFFDRKEVKDALSYLRLVIFRDDLSFERIANVPKRNLGRRRMAFLREYADAHGTSLFAALCENLDEPIMAGTKARELVAFVEGFGANVALRSASELMAEVLDKSGYERMLRTEGGQERLDNLAELRQAIYEFETTCGEESVAVAFLSHAALMSNLDAGLSADKVKLMTIHAAKGLEFPFVFLCALDEGVLPSRKTQTVEQMEEERRLAFVAMTRARDGLVLTCADGTAHDGLARYPSRFVLDVDPGLMSFVTPLEDSLVRAAREHIAHVDAKLLVDDDLALLPPGTRVRHITFGEGTIEETDAEMRAYRIAFDNLPTPRVLSFRAPLEVLE